MSISVVGLTYYKFVTKSSHC